MLKAQRKREPQNTDVLMAMQELALMHRNVNKALRLQDDIDKIEGKTPQNVLRRYQLTLMTGKPDKAAAVIENYCREDPDDEYFPVLVIAEFQTFFAVFVTSSAVASLRGAIFSIDSN